MERRRFSLPKILLAMVALVAAAAITHALWLPWFAYALIRDDGPAKADIAVVLAGDYQGERVVKAAELLREGYVPAVLVSGIYGFYGRTESDLAIAYALSRGYPADGLISFPVRAHSTSEEVSLILPELRRRGIRSFLLVTSTYHTARSARDFLRIDKGSGIAMRVVAAPTRSFQPDYWWRDRESSKMLLLEWTKTIADFFGI